MAYRRGYENLMALTVIGTCTFKTKDAARAEIRRILHSSPIGAALTESDLTFVRALYEMHPRKKGAPVAFCVGINCFHGSNTRGFHAIHPDGARTPWSYLPCLSPETDAPNLVKALRAAIMDSQRTALRKNYGERATRPCHACKQPVARKNAHVHHLPPKFRDIMNAFLGLVGSPEIVTAPLGDALADDRIAARWVAFHDSVAQRVVLCAGCNAEDERSHEG